jgi:hypothetical protein
MDRPELDQVPNDLQQLVGASDDISASEFAADARQHGGSTWTSRRTSMMKLFTALSALAFTAGACIDSADPTDGHGADLPPKLELAMTATIPGGSEVEYCQFVTVPETWITRDTVAFTAGSHHVLIYQTPYASIPTQKTDGTQVATGGVFDCSDGVTNGWSLTKVIGGSQNQSGESILSFPEGVGVRIGGVLLINAHYRNGSDGPVTAEVKVTFDTTTTDRLEQEGDVLFYYNPLISVPAGGTARARWRCPVYQDITITNAQSHMHARGVGYAAGVAGEAPFYVNDSWNGAPVQRYENLTVKAGSKLDYHCDYRNTGGKPIYQGPRTTDEMCMLVASYYPAEPRTASCLDESGTVLGGEWIGEGTASCGQTLACLQTAGTLQAQTDCMRAASPAVSRESSDLLRCFMGAQDPSAQCAAQIRSCSAR